MISLGFLLGIAGLLGFFVTKVFCYKKIKVVEIGELIQFYCWAIIPFAVCFKFPEGLFIRLGAIVGTLSIVLHIIACTNKIFIDKYLRKNETGNSQLDREIKETTKREIRIIKNIGGILKGFWLGSLSAVFLSTNNMGECSLFIALGIFTFLTYLFDFIRVLSKKSIPLIEIIPMSELLISIEMAVTMGCVIFYILM